MYYVFLLIAYVAALFTPISVYLAICFVTGLRYRGYACLFIAFLIDAQFSLITTLIPVYTLTTMAVLVLAEVIRPYIAIDTVS